MSPRQKSDDSISVGLKRLRAKVDLPDPDVPIRTTKQSSGNFMCTAKTPPSAWVVQARYLHRQRVESAQSNRTAWRLNCTTTETQPASTRSDDLCVEILLPAIFRICS